ncbi:MAG: hypothetical protein GF364_12095 [Candidatus Lokiarchaeota archaeon]|nr:hypothetical protein [Candidatus Lokiarchaeota archaeon]
MLNQDRGKKRQPRYKKTIIIIGLIILGVFIPIFYFYFKINYFLEKPVISEIIIRAPTNFDFSSDDEVSDFMHSIKETGISRVSLLVKQDEDALDESDLSDNPIASGSLYYNESEYDFALPDINYDILNSVLSCAHDLDLEIYAWIPLFRDFTARTYNSSWALEGTGDATYFIDPQYEEARAYELSIIEEILAYDIDGIRLDYLRYCDANSDPARTNLLTTFLSELNALNPNVPIGFYGFPPSEYYWSGQNYTAFSPYINTIHPMIYWQDKGDITNNILKTLDYVSSITKSIKEELGSLENIIPVLSITDWVNVRGHYQTFSENKIRLYMDLIMDRLTKSAIERISLFYYGNWVNVLERLEYLNI